MGNTKKPWAILLPGPVVQFCVERAAVELVGRSLMQEAAVRLLKDLDRHTGPGEPNRAIANVLARALRLPWRDRAAWVAHRLKGCKLQEAAMELRATVARSCYMGTCVIDMAWVPGLASALRGTMWSKIEPQYPSQAYAEQLPFCEDTPRQLLKAGGHPDLGRYLCDYLEKHPFGDDDDVEL